MTDRVPLAVTKWRPEMLAYFNKWKNPIQQRNISTNMSAISLFEKSYLTKKAKIKQSKQQQQTNENFTFRNIVHVSRKTFFFSPLKFYASLSDKSTGILGFCYHCEWNLSFILHAIFILYFFTVFSSSCILCIWMGKPSILLYWYIQLPFRTILLGLI